MSTLTLFFTYYPVTLPAGSTCTTPDRSPGVCRLLSSCQFALDELGKGRRPKICLFSGPHPIVCCPGSTAGKPAKPAATGRPPTPPRQIGRTARKKCNEYAAFVFAEEESLVLMPTRERVDRCAASADPLIVGGSRAKGMEFPHMALIGYGEKDEIDYECGGSLISPQFVLTASHCLVSPNQNRPARWVLLGELDRSTSEDEAEPQLVEVAERIKHPDYKPPASYHDIALLRLAQQPEMTGYVRPACLHTEPELRTRDSNPEIPVATGWGHTEWGGESSNQLMKVALREENEDKCSKAYASVSTRKLPRGIDAKSQVCAGGEGKDTCQGDSGGPLQVSTKNYSRAAIEPYCMYKIVGITSFGQACGFRAPGVYTRVFHYVPWIESIVWP